jgi:hypothetical protein
MSEVALAQQNSARPSVFPGRSAPRGVVALVDRAFEHAALAGAARAVLAAVGQADAVAQGRARMVSSVATSNLWPLGITVT